MNDDDQARVPEDIVKLHATATAEADRIGFTQAGQLIKLLMALKSAPTLEVRVTFKSKPGEEAPAPGPRVIEMIIADLCEAHQQALARIHRLELLVVGGELREKVGNLEASQERLSNQLADTVSNDWEHVKLTSQDITPRLTGIAPFADGETLEDRIERVVTEMRSAGKV